MAYIDENQQDPQNPGRIVTSGGGGGTYGGGGGQGAKPTQSGSFANLQGYMQANEGKGAGLVDTATKDTQNQYNTVTQGVTDASANAVNTINSGVKKRSDFSNDEAGFNAYGQYIKDAKFEAPDIAGNYSTQTANVNKAGEEAKRGGAQWAAGLGANVSAGTGGNRLLNSAIIGGDRSAADRAGQLQNQWTGLSGYVNQQQGNASNAAYQADIGNQAKQAKYTSYQNQAQSARDKSAQDSAEVRGAYGNALASGNQANIIQGKQQIDSYDAELNKNLQGIWGQQF